MYGNTITASMERAIKETERRREIQIKYNEDHGIVPQTIIKDIREIIEATQVAEETIEYNSLEDAIKANNDDIEKLIGQYETEMREASKKLEFEKAAQLRDLVLELKKKLKKSKGK